MSETPRPTQAQTLAETALDQSTHLEVTFPDAPAYLTATEATATLSALTYLHDLALSQEHPDLLKGGSLSSSTHVTGCALLLSRRCGSHESTTALPSPSNSSSPPSPSSRFSRS